MMEYRLLRRGLTAFDVMLIAGIALVPILAWRGIRVMEFGLIPLLLAPFLWRQVAPDRNDWLMIALFGQYAVLVALNVLVYPVLPETTSGPGTKVALYLGSAVLLLMLVPRFRLARHVGSIWRVIGPASVLVSVALLGWDYLTAPAGEACRVGYLSKHLLIPPLWLTVFAVASYAGWDRLQPWERWLRHAALALVILATVGFAGGRAMLAAQAVTIPILALLLGRGELALRRLQIVAVLGAVSFAGFGAGLALDVRAKCQFFDRLVAIVTTIDRSEEAEDLALQTFSRQFEDSEAGAPAVAPPPDSEEFLVGAVYIRPILWQQALERIRERPLFGYGHLNETALIVGDFPHFHQQYLSWLVWGGPLMLASGLLMLFAPLFTFGVRRSRDGAILALAMIAPLGISFLAATNLLHTVMLLGYAMTLALLHALSREEARDNAG